MTGKASIHIQVFQTELDQQTAVSQSKDVLDLLAQGLLRRVSGLPHPNAHEDTPRKPKAKGKDAS